jgi:hypothetical protein
MSWYGDADGNKVYFDGGVLTTNCDTLGRWIFRVDGAGPTKGPAIPRNFSLYPTSLKLVLIFNLKNVDSKEDHLMSDYYRKTL